MCFGPAQWCSKCSLGIFRSRSRKRRSTSGSRTSQPPAWANVSEILSYFLVNFKNANHRCPGRHRSTSCRLFDKFASTARAAMCSLQTFCGVEYHGSGGLFTLPSCKTRASRCRSLCFPWTWRRPLICLQLIRIVDVGLLHGSEGHCFTGPCYAKLAFPFPAFVCASLG